MLSEELIIYICISRFTLRSMVNRAKLAKYLKDIEGFSLDTLRDRKILQKKTYLLQQLGLDFGCGYGFYIYGPYSPELTRDAYALKSQLEIAPETIDMEELSKSEKKAIEKLNEFLADIDPKDLARELELLTSVHFLSSLSYSKIKTVEQIKKELSRKKPRVFSDEEIERAWRKLSDFNLL